MSLRERRVLGRTGLQVSRVGLASGYGIPEASVERAVKEHGINYLYWSLARRGGMTRALRSLGRTPLRDQLVIAFQSYDHSGLLLSTFHERSLRKLNLDHALSAHRRANFRELLERGPSQPIDIFMVRYNAAHRGAETEIFPHLPADVAARPGVTTYTATRWGQLLKPGKMPAGEAPLSAADCYRFALSHPTVDLCMIGPKDEAQLSEAVRALDAGPLGEEELVRARRIGDHVHG